MICNIFCFRWKLRTLSCTQIRYFNGGALYEILYISAYNALLHVTQIFFSNFKYVRKYLQNCVWLSYLFLKKITALKKKLYLFLVYTIGFFVIKRKEWIISFLIRKYLLHEMCEIAPHACLLGWWNKSFVCLLTSTRFAWY